MFHRRFGGPEDLKERARIAVLEERAERRDRDLAVLQSEFEVAALPSSAAPTWKLPAEMSTLRAQLEVAPPAVLPQRFRWLS
jgi:hypothetical protein